MQDFTQLMKNPQNRIPDTDQHTQGVGGYYFKGEDGSQMAYWICHADQTSKEHSHEFDEYMICINCQYTVIIGDEEIVLGRGDEFFIPKVVTHGSKVKTGTRTIHAFGGKRIQNKP